MSELDDIIARAQSEFARLLQGLLDRGPVALELYVRFLSMQYHLTKGVQRYFIVAAAHSDMAKRKKLRRFLLEFANEEELHYLVAASDLRKLGSDPLPEPLDVTLWHAYFNSIIATRPFIRLGAACILENMSGGVARDVTRKALVAPFLNRDNTKFLVLHQHEVLPHGEQLVDALTKADLTAAQMEDVLDGARKGLVMYLRMAEWAVDPTSLASRADTRRSGIDMADRAEIDAFKMEDLELGPVIRSNDEKRPASP